MSNITVYSTPSILADSSFLNNFLDSLLENYCSANFTPNVAYPSVNITLEKLIQYNYPNHYIRSYGLLGHKTSTDVLKIYDESLHTAMVSSLEHKLSRLFINITGSTKTLKIIEQKHTYDFSICVLHLSSVRDILKYFIEVAGLNLLNEQDIKKLLNINTYFTEHTLCSVDTDNLLVYKPTLDYYTEVDNLIKAKNEKILTDIIKRNSTSYNLFLRLIFSVSKFNSLRNAIFPNVTPEFFKHFEKECQEHLNVLYLTVQEQQEINNNRKAEEAERIKLEQDRAETVSRIQSKYDLYSDEFFINRGCLDDKSYNPPKINHSPIKIKDIKDIEDIEEIKPQPVTVTKINIDKVVLYPLIAVIIYFVLLMIFVSVFPF